MVAWVYAAASVVLGPGIVFGIGHHRSGFDCSDASWGYTPLAQRHATYQELKDDVVPAAAFMLAVGVAVLVALLVRRKTGTAAEWMIPALAVLAMMAGYGSILALADWLWSCTSL